MAQSGSDAALRLRAGHRPPNWISPAKILKPDSVPTLKAAQATIDIHCSPVTF
jgi:hypothetical protein